MKIEHRTTKSLSSGRPYPQGATVTPEGINFALFSQHAREVYLLLYDAPLGEPTDVIRLEHQTDHVWHVHVHGLLAGQLYGYRVRGEYDPANGLRFNENKLLIDPYARALSGPYADDNQLLLGYDPQHTRRDLSFDSRDSEKGVPKCVVTGGDFDWENDRPLRIPHEDLVIYEVHVRGFTMHPSAQVDSPGTFLGFIEKIPHLKELGVNAVELLPVHESFTPAFLTRRGLSDYWGYNSIGFFAPAWRYGSGETPGCQVDEFKQLVKALHRAGIEVILDVVYNHTGEGNEMGPTLCFRGVDNPVYYRLKGLSDAAQRFYINDTGTGNSLNVAYPQVLRMIIDSLRYWVTEMHVDGFRFDLATVLGKRNNKFDPHAPFFRAVSSDPILSQVRHIAEPWDVATYEAGHFPPGWLEWNDKYRDTARRFLRGDSRQVRDLGWRLTGSEDLHRATGRFPFHSLNFITCHDGFTLYDLFSYNRKHNEQNLERNRDGTDENYSFNCGREGESSYERVHFLRKRLIKNSFSLLLFSLGTPMMLGGDEMLRTQLGNNNAYCQDNYLSWFRWDRLLQYDDIFQFVKKAIRFRMRYPLLRRKTFVAGYDFNGNNIPDIQWYGRDLKAPSWDNPKKRTICYQLDGSEIPSALGEYYLFFIFNSDHRAMNIKLPQHAGFAWHRVVDTALAAGDDFLDAGEEMMLKQQDHYKARGRSVVVLLAR